MFRYNNTHIFTGYLKQLLSSVNIPTCKIYTQEFARYLAQHGKEDPRVIESIDTINEKRLAARVNYLKNNEIYNYFWTYSEAKPALGHANTSWKRVSTVFYDSEKAVPGLTKTLHIPGRSYDTVTHEYLGEYLRFLRDYHNINLMSLYNCFNNKVCNNIYFSFIPDTNVQASTRVKVLFDSQDAKHLIYAIPVKLFENYTIAIDSSQGIEMFCGLYNTILDTTDKTLELATKTYKKVNRAIFKQPFIYDKLDIKYWLYENDILTDKDGKESIKTDTITRWDIINREQDLRLFIKVPTSCKSSIVILEGNFKNFNDCFYAPNITDIINMSNCLLGSEAVVKGDIAKELKGYQEEQCKTTKASIADGKTSASENLPIWTQGSVQAPVDSDGDGWYEITNGEELAYIIQYGGRILNSQTDLAHFKITNDIYINDPTKIDWQTGQPLDSEYNIRTWYQVTETANEITPFRGTIEGNGFTIHGLYVNNTIQNSSTGLLPILDSDAATTVRNLKIDHAYLRSTNAAAFAGSVTKAVNKPDTWSYLQNHCAVNFGSKYEKIDSNAGGFMPISKLQLLAFNTNESYPFSDRLVEYLIGSAITPIEPIHDNIKRAQKVMTQNGNYFSIEGLWENKMQKLIYDYIVNAGPVEVGADGKLLDKRQGYHARLGHNSKSMLYDVLGYIDRDAEKWYASWKKENGKAVVRDSIQNVDIYNGLYDI